MNVDTIIWLGLIVLFIYMESTTVQLVSMWFALGGLVAVVATFLEAPVWVQLVLFFGVSSLTMVCLRPLLKKYIKPKIVATNVDAIIGSTGYVTADIDNLNAQGQVKLGGMPWTARSTNGEPLPTGTLVQVDRIEGVKAYVSVVNK